MGRTYAFRIRERNVFPVGPDEFCFCYAPGQALWRAALVGAPCSSEQSAKKTDASILVFGGTNQWPDLAGNAQV
jgi:hypothetical protein